LRSNTKFKIFQW